MKMKLLLALMGSIFFIQSCATAPTRDITSVPSADQKMGYDGTLFSKKKHSLSLSPFTDFDSTIQGFDFTANKAKFMLTIKNGGKEPITIDNENLSVTIAGGGKDGEPRKINIQSLDEFMEDFEKEYNNSEKKYIYNKIYNLYYQEKLIGLGLEELTDRLQEFLWDLETIRSQEEGLREALQKMILTRQTIMPGRSYTGIVVCDTSGLDTEMAGTFRVVVSIDGETHIFSFHWRAFS